MRTKGSAEELEHRRELAIRRLKEGYSVSEVAKFLEVSARSIRRWRTSYKKSGKRGLKAHPVSGRPRKLTRTQEKIVRRWLFDSPTEHGFSTDLWTAKRLAVLIRREFRVIFNPDYLTTWLRTHDVTPQIPEKTPREKDPLKIAFWLAHDWPRIKKKRSDKKPTSFS